MRTVHEQHPARGFINLSGAMMREKVIVVGGGIAGLTAAHELAERGFDVHVYERRH
ncbi:MAG: FAD-dependent oxidoreductase, partial [Polyangiales bacterium]